MKKVYIIDENNDYSKELQKEVNAEICYFNSSETALEEMLKRRPDVIITDLLLSKMDGFEFIEKINTYFKDQIKIVVCTGISQDKFVAKAMELGVYYYMLKPINIANLAKRVEEALNEVKVMRIVPNTQNANKALDEKISYIFMTVGIPAHIKGYKFLREAIKLSIQDPNIINSITKKLYPSIAERFETTSSKVERAIRHAIEVAWNRGKIENINDLFGVTVYSSNEKPTNGEFIALVADKMLMEM
ncbi:MAG: sporulation transcription factor Spo0A [Christensenellales bacterium]